MVENLREDMVSTSVGRDLLLRSLHKVLERHGYKGQQLEAKIAELQQKDFPRLTTIILGSNEDENGDSVSIRAAKITNHVNNNW